jgi:hypothetical protein
VSGWCSLADWHVRTLQNHVSTQNIMQQQERTLGAMLVLFDEIDWKLSLAMMDTNASLSMAGVQSISP